MGLVTAIVGRRGLGWWIAMGTTPACAAMSIQLLLSVQAQGSVSYLMGNWPVPYGIGYVVDPLNAAVLAIVSLVACVITLYARKSVASEIPAGKLHFFYALWQFCLTGLLGIT